MVAEHFKKDYPKTVHVNFETIASFSFALKLFRSGVFYSADACCQTAVQLAVARLGIFLARFVVGSRVFDCKAEVT